MSKHTPGPWRYWACRVDSMDNPPMYDYAQFANLKEHVFRAPLRYLREEDARLIAAAPDLLEALKELLGCPSGDYDTTDDYANARKKAEAAIAKAEGQQ